MQFVCCFVVVDYGQNVAFEGGFALHEKAHFKTLIDERDVRKKNNSFELYFEEENVTAVFDTITKHEFELVRGVIEQPWR